jgi:activating signal cointegrator complex subunit 2
LATEAERTFDIIFALLELPSSSPETNNTSSPTPFLDRSLLADYQHAHSLSHALASALRHAADKDARLDLLESTLQSLDSDSSSSDPGILKILLRTSGIPPGIDNLGNGSKVRSTQATADTKGKGKGKGKAPVQNNSSSSDPDIEIKIAQVLDILPDHPPEYIHALLEHPPLERNPEKVVGALLEGTAPGPEEFDRSPSEDVDVVRRQDEGEDDVERYVRERKNVFDGETMDMAQLRIGKKRYSSLFLRKLIDNPHIPQTRRIHSLARSDVHRADES